MGLWQEAGSPPHPLRVRTRVGVSGRPGPRYLHVSREVEDVVPLLRGISLPGRQQEHLVAALRLGARHGGALQTVVAVLWGALRAAASRVHGSGLRAGRGVSGSVQRPQEQQHQHRGPQKPSPLHGLEPPPGPRTRRRGRGLSSPTAPIAVTSVRRLRREGRGERRAWPGEGRL